MQRKLTSEEALEKQGSKEWMCRSESLGEREGRKDASFCRERERKEKLQIKKGIFVFLTIKSGYYTND